MVLRVLLMNRQKCDPLLLGMVVLEALMIENYENSNGERNL